MMHKDTLSREHRYLRRRLEQLTTTVNVNKRRSVSESSNYTTASGASTTSTSSACSTSSSPSISESGTSIEKYELPAAESAAPVRGETTLFLFLPKPPFSPHGVATELPVRLVLRSATTWWRIPSVERSNQYSNIRYWNTIFHRTKSAVSTPEIVPLVFLSPCTRTSNNTRIDFRFDGPSTAV